MIEIAVTAEFIKRYKSLPVSIKNKAEKQEKLFKHNPFYSSLNTEKLAPKSEQAEKEVNNEAQ